MMVWSLRRGERRVRIAALVLLGVGGLLLLKNYVWLTPAQKARKLTREMIACVEHRDTARLDALLAPNATLAHIWNKAEILQRYQAIADGLHIQSLRINSIAVSDHGDVETVVLGVTARFDSSGPLPADSVPSTWQLDWVQSADGWLLQTITPTQLAGQDPAEIGRFLTREAPP
jgi:hypothetical protein